MTPPAIVRAKETVMAVLCVLILLAILAVWAVLLSGGAYPW